MTKKELFARRLIFRGMGVGIWKGPLFNPPTSSILIFFLRRGKMSAKFLKFWVLFIVALICFSCQEQTSTDGSQPPEETVSYKVYGLNFSPYQGEQDPNLGVEIPATQIRERMEIIADYTRWIRTFGCTHGLENAGSIAHEWGLKAAIGAWLDANRSTNEKEIENLIMCAQAGEADLLIVGSEVLLRGDLTEEELLGYIERVKTLASDLPVAYADVYSVFLKHPRIVEAVDVILVNYYPYWEGIRVEQAVAAVNQWHQQILEIAQGKRVIVSETGWPSAGNTIDQAVPSLENASYYFLNFVSWARANGVDYFYFEAFDEPWKAKYEGPQGAHWGIWNEDGQLKPGMERVFDGETMEDNWSHPLPGGPGEPTIEFTYVPPYGSFEDLVGQVWHVNPNDYGVAVYIRVAGGWWTKPYWNQPLTPIRVDGRWKCDITTGGRDQEATEIAAFLWPKEKDPPLAHGEAWLPESLEENAAAWIEVSRSP